MNISFVPPATIMSISEVRPGTCRLLGLAHIAALERVYKSRTGKIPAVVFAFPK